MTLTDYAIDIALIALVILQVRGRRITGRTLLIPVILVGWAASSYLHGIPTAGNDLVLIIGATAIGVTLGALCAVFTTVRAGSDGFPVAKAGMLAAVLWVIGVGTRLAFQVYVTHGGEGAVERFSAAHSITTSEAWVAALILMAMGEVLARTGILALRARTVSSSQWFRPGAIMGAGDRAY